MEQYKIAGNHVMFEELDSDSLGTNYRAGVIKDKKVEKHCLLTEVYPDIVNSPKAWRRVKILIEGINNQNIPGLYCPEKIVEEDQRALLVYPFINGKSFETLLEDTTRNHTAMELELIFSIVFEIADALDNSSAIIINKNRSFHGVVTPDNIFVDFDGKVYLRNYGIFPYLEDAPQLLTETIKKFKDMFSPEVLQNKGLTVQSDIYHLGNIVHRLLTGNYFQHLPGEDFDSRLAKIDLEEFIMLPEESYGPKIMQLLKKTLNPDPSKRFASIKEFKEYISKYFRIEELSSATFRLAYFMNQEYKKTIEEREKLFPEELSYSVPEIKPKAKAVIPIRDKIDDAMIEDILIELEQQKRSRVKIIIPFVVILLVVIGISGYLFITQKKEAQLQKQAQIKLQEEAERRIAEVKEQLIAEYQKQIKAIEARTAVTEEEKKAQADEIERLKTWRTEQEQEQVKLIRERTEALARLEREKQQRESQPIEKPKPVEIAKPKETDVTAKPDIKPPVEQPKLTQPEVKTLNIGDMIPLDSVTFAPSKLSGRSGFKSQDLKLPGSVLNQYGGQNLTVESDILINEFGSVADTKIKGGLAAELQAEVNNILKSWRYIAAEKDKIKVKVWIPAKLTIAFEGKSPKATVAEAPKITEPVPLNALTYEPSKISGTSKLAEDDLKLTDATKKIYAGQTLNIKASILINEGGKVTDVKIQGNWPNEITSKVKDVLQTWTYTPGEKNKVKVKVWLPGELTIAFKKPAPPKEVEIPIPTTLTPLDAVTYRPSKMSGSANLKGNDLKLPGDIKKQYKGKAITIDAAILINEVGSIIRVTIKGTWPDELKSNVEKQLRTWKYIPAEKDTVKVAVWLPVRVKVDF
jgi:serine/threonine protein kinase